MAAGILPTESITFVNTQVKQPNVTVPHLQLLQQQRSFKCNLFFWTRSVYNLCKHARLCLCFTHDGSSFSNKEEFSERSVERQQHSDTGGILVLVVFHGNEKLPQRSQQCQLTGPAVTMEFKLRTRQTTTEKRSYSVDLCG